MAKELTKKQLYDRVWKAPMIEVAKEYGLSDRGLAKLCERHGIPVPPRGYWARKKAGQKVGKPKLITLDKQEPDTILMIKRAIFQKETLEGINTEHQMPADIEEAMNREKLEKNRIAVSKTLSNPHVIVARWIKEEERQRESYRQYGNSWSRPEKITDLEHRRRRILSSLLKAIENRGFQVETDRERQSYIWISSGRDRVVFSLAERIRQYRRELTAEEKKERYNSNQRWTQIHEPSGELLLRISSSPRYSYQAKDFVDAVDCPLELQLNAVMASIIERIWHETKRRLEDEAEQHERWQQEQARQKREEEIKAEQARKSALETKASNWKKAQDIRDYIAAVQASDLAKEPEFQKWKEWAMAHAGAIDPIANGNPFID